MSRIGLEKGALQACMIGPEKGAPQKCAKGVLQANMIGLEKGVLQKRAKGVLQMCMIGPEKGVLQANMTGLEKSALEGGGRIQGPWRPPAQPPNDNLLVKHILPHGGVVKSNLMERPPRRRTFPAGLGRDGREQHASRAAVLPRLSAQ